MERIFEFLMKRLISSKTPGRDIIAFQCLSMSIVLMIKDAVLLMFDFAGGLLRMVFTVLLMATLAGYIVVGHPVVTVISYARQKT